MKKKKRTHTHTHTHTCFNQKQLDYCSIYCRNSSSALWRIVTITCRHGFIITVKKADWVQSSTILQLLDVTCLLSVCDTCNLSPWPSHSVGFCTWVWCLLFHEIAIHDSLESHWNCTYTKFLQQSCLSLLTGHSSIVSFLLSVCELLVCMTSMHYRELSDNWRWAWPHVAPSGTHPVHPM